MTLSHNDYYPERARVDFYATYELGGGPYTATVRFQFETDEWSDSDDYRLAVLEAGLQAMLDKVDTDHVVTESGYSVTLIGLREETVVTNP